MLLYSVTSLRYPQISLKYLANYPSFPLVTAAACLKAAWDVGRGAAVEDSLLLEKGGGGLSRLRARKGGRHLAGVRRNAGREVAAQTCCALL